MKLVMTSLLEKSTQPGQPLGDDNKPPFMIPPSLHKPNQVNNTSHSGITTPGSGAARKATSDVPYRYNENPHTGVINRRLEEINSFNPEVLSFTQAEALLYAAGHGNPNATQSPAIWANAGCGVGVDHLNYPGAFYRSSTMYRAECGEAAGYSTALRSMHKPIDLLPTSRTLPKLRSGEQRTSCSMESSFVHAQSSPNERSNSETETNSFHHTLMHPYFSWDELRHQHVSYPRNPYEHNISSVNFASRFPTQMYPRTLPVNPPHPTPAEVPTMTSSSNPNQHLGLDIQQQVSPLISFVPGDVPAQGFSAQNIDAPLSYFQPPSFNQLIRELQSNPWSDSEGIQASNPWRGLPLYNRFPENDDTNLRKLSDVCASASDPDNRLPNVAENKNMAHDFSPATVSSEELLGHGHGRKGFPRSRRYLSRGDILSGRASESWGKLNFAAAKCAEMSSSSKPKEGSFCSSEAEIDVVGCESEKVPLAAMVKKLTMPKRRKRSTGVQQSECNVCGKKLSRASTLKIHMRQHTGDRPFKCTVCAKTFAQAGLLQSHSRIHTGERPFTCSYCRKKFSHSGALKTHVRTHTGERPHKCPAVGCDLAFGDSSTLSKHTRTHTGERPYACDICGKRFTQSGNMHKHKKYVHKVWRNCQSGKATAPGLVVRAAEKGKLVQRLLLG